jgi:hypothetical protein
MTDGSWDVSIIAPYFGEDNFSQPPGFFSLAGLNFNFS